MDTYRIVLADDHVLFRQGIKSLLDASGGYDIVGEAGDGVALLRLLYKVAADMILLDISMPTLGGIEATREIQSICPSAKIVILTMHKDKEYIHASISAGCHGYLLKEDADSALFSAIETVRKGGSYLSPLLSDNLINAFIRRDDDCSQSLADPLSLREREVLKLIAEGAANKEVADLLSISVRTVEHHRASIMQKLNIRQTARLIKYAIGKGYTSLEL